MQHLSEEKYGDFAKQKQVVEEWLKQKDEEIEKAVSSSWGNDFGLVVTFLSALCCVITLIYTVVTAPPGPNPPFHWPVIGWVFLSTVVVGMLIQLCLMRLTVGRRRTMRKDLRTKLCSDPLYVRAELLKRAIHDYRAHCSKYRAWVSAVDDRLTAADEEAGKRYFEFINRAHSVLVRALKNFQDTVELLKRQETFREKHPELEAKPDSTALSDLIAQLDQPVEVPPSPVLANPRASLEFEETLVRVTNDLEKDELTERIEDAAARTSARIKDK